MRKTTGTKNADNVTPEQQIWASRLMGALGFALLTGFFLTLAYSVFENSKTIAVQGTVISNYTKGSSSEYQTYGHEFSFVDKDGNKRTGSDNGERQSRYRVGTHVAIGYYPDTPSRIRIHSWFGLWELQLVLFGLGSFLIWYMFAAIKLIKSEALLHTNS
jgi:uncharacterized protein (DUF58 family)